MKKDCEICGGTDLLPFDEFHRGIDIVACKKCGLTWNRNMSEEGEMLQFYTHQNRADGEVSRFYLLSMLARAACVIPMIRDYIKPGMKHLDVGCAEGTLLALTRTHGLQVQGLEVDEHYSKFARDVRGLEVSPLTLDKADLPAQSFDLISMVHVTEHLYYPVEVLKTVRGLLKPEGRFFIEVPNMDQPLPGRRHFFRPIHNFYFTKNTLRALLVQAGFTPLKVGFSGRDGSVQVLARVTRENEAPIDIRQWRDDARKWRAKTHREKYRWYLIFKMLFTHLLAQEWHKQRALREYGPKLPELQKK